MSRPFKSQKVIDEVISEKKLNRILKKVLDFVDTFINGISRK